MSCLIPIFIFFFFNDTATTEIYTLSLHDALPICHRADPRHQAGDQKGAWLRGKLRDREAPARGERRVREHLRRRRSPSDRKSTRLKSSHSQISYAVFCLKKKKIAQPHFTQIEGII